MGKYCINWPEVPGQKKSGTNAASVVDVDARTGQNIRLAAVMYACFFSMPSDIFLSAYSITTMAPSINMPSPSNIPNITIKLNDKPSA